MDWRWLSGLAFVWGDVIPKQGAKLKCFDFPFALLTISALKGWKSRWPWGWLESWGHRWGRWCSSRSHWWGSSANDTRHGMLLLLVLVLVLLLFKLKFDSRGNIFTIFSSPGPTALEQTLLGTACHGHELAAWTLKTPRRTRDSCMEWGWIRWGWIRQRMTQYVTSRREALMTNKEKKNKKKVNHTWDAQTFVKRFKHFFCNEIIAVHFCHHPIHFDLSIFEITRRSAPDPGAARKIKLSLSMLKARRPLQRSLYLSSWRLPAFLQIVLIHQFVWKE